MIYEISWQAVGDPVSLMIRVSSRILGTWRSYRPGEDMSNANCHYWPAEIRQGGAGCVHRPGRYRRRRVLHPRQGGRPARPASGRSRRTRRQRCFSSRSLKGPEALEALRSLDVDLGRHGLRAAVRAAGVHRHPAPRHDPVSPVAAARDIAARAPSTGPSSAATRARGSRSSGRATVSTKARSSCRRRPPSVPTTRWGACISTGCSRWAWRP